MREAPETLYIISSDDECDNQWITSQVNTLKTMPSKLQANKRAASKNSQQIGKDNEISVESSKQSL